MVAGTRQAVAAVHRAGRFPLLLGGDCPVMLGALAATRYRHGAVGLVMLDGHEDAYPPRRSPTGEAADSGLALALGMADGLPDGLAQCFPCRPHQVGLLGPRDEAAIAGGGGAAAGRGPALVRRRAGRPGRGRGRRPGGPGGGRGRRRGGCTSTWTCWPPPSWPRSTTPSRAACAGGSSAR